MTLFLTFTELTEWTCLTQPMLDGPNLGQPAGLIIIITLCFLVLSRGHFLHYLLRRGTMGVFSPLNSLYSNCVHLQQITMKIKKCFQLFLLSVFFSIRHAFFMRKQHHSTEKLLSLTPNTPRGHQQVNYNSRCTNVSFWLTPPHHKQPQIATEPRGRC
jgi:hypothetical protein